MAKKEKKNVELVDLQQALLLADEALKDLPQNKINEFMPVIKKLKLAGMTWAKIAEFLRDKVGLEIKTFTLKETYYKINPDEKPEPKQKAEPKADHAEQKQEHQQPQAEQPRTGPQPARKASL